DPLRLDLAAVNPPDERAEERALERWSPGAEQLHRSTARLLVFEPEEDLEPEERLVGPIFEREGEGAIARVRRHERRCGMLRVEELGDARAVPDALPVVIDDRELAGARQLGRLPRLEAVVVHDRELQALRSEDAPDLAAERGDLPLVEDD